MKKNNVIYDKSFEFAIRIINVYKSIVEEKKEFVMSKQLLRAGTSIGANVKEGLAAQSKKDFVAKLYIASKEAHETEYWLELLTTTGYIEQEQAKTLLDELKQIKKILSSIILTTKNNMDKQR